MSDFFSKLFDTSDFPDRWHCGTWSDFHGWLHILSDLTVFGAYVTIPFVMLYFLRRRQDIPFPRVFFLFAAFVFACGTVHLLEATIFWLPIYRISGLAKLLTAIISWATVIGLVRILPAATTMRTAKELESEIFLRKQAELRFRALLESAPDATVITSDDGTVVLVNREAEKLFGFAREELFGRSIEALVPSQEFIGRRKDGSEFPVEVSQGPIQTEDGRLISNAIRDITERLASQQELEREHARFEAIVSAIPDSLMFANTDRQITYCNPAVKKLFGYESGELVGQSMAVLYEDLSDYEEPGDESFQAGVKDEKIPFASNWKRKDGSLFPGETIGTVVRDSGGNPIGFLGLIRDVTERLKAEESLRIQEQALLSERKLANEAQSSFGRIVEESLDEIYIVDAETLNFLQVNRGARRNTGYNMDELRSMTPLDIAPNQTPESIDKLVAALHSGDSGKLTFEEKQRRKDGSYYDAEIHLQLNTYLGREAYVAFVRDITERNQIQYALQKSERRFSAFMDNSPFVAWVKDSQGQYVYVSRASEATLGIPVEDWLGKTDFDFWPKEVAEKYIELDAKVAETGQTISFESTDPLPNQTTQHWYVVKFPFNIEGDEVLIGGIAVDMTEQRRAESERDRFFETSFDMMCIANFDNYFTRVNQSFIRTLGYSREELLSKPFTDFVHPSDVSATLGAAQTIEKGGRVNQFENRYRHKDGSYRLISWNTPVPEPDATVLFAVGRDITKHRELERSVLQVADNEQRRIAHDLHDGLGQELAGASMMARSLANKLSGKFEAEAELATKIADQLSISLQHSRSIARGIRPVEIESHGLQSALLNLADRTSDAYPVDCSFHAAHDLQPSSLESATHLYRIAQEAVTNAAKHGSPKTIEIYLGENDEALELKVVDDGCGIGRASSSHEGIGMKSMRYRSNLIGARLEVQPRQSGGTIVVCRLASY